MSANAVHPVDERLPAARLAALGLQHVLVMYAGAIAVPLIVGRALKLSPEQVALLISADLFCCGLVTLIQSLGFGRHFGISDRFENDRPRRAECLFPGRCDLLRLVHWKAAQINRTHDRVQGAVCRNAETQRDNGG